MAPLTRSKREPSSPSKKSLESAKRAKLSPQSYESGSEAEETLNYLQYHVQDDDDSDGSFDAESSAADEEDDEIDLIEEEFDTSNEDQNADLDLIANAAGSVIGEHNNPIVIDDDDDEVMGGLDPDQSNSTQSNSTQSNSTRTSVPDEYPAPFPNEHAIYGDADSMRSQHFGQVDEALHVPAALTAAPQLDEGPGTVVDRRISFFAGSGKVLAWVHGFDDSVIVVNDQDASMQDNGEGSNANTGDRGYIDDSDFIDDTGLSPPRGSSSLIAPDMIASAAQQAPVPEGSPALNDFDHMTASAAQKAPVPRKTARRRKAPAQPKTAARSKTAARRKTAAQLKTTARPKTAAQSSSPAKDEANTTCEESSSSDDDSGDEDAPKDGNKKALGVTIQGPDLSLPPLFKLREIIQDLLKKAVNNGLQKYVDQNKQYYLTVGTVCSGTDAPLHVLNLFGMLKNENGDQVFTTVNKFACEIEPFKQAFLLRNSKPELLFRDVTEFAQPGAKRAHLVSGAEADIPDVDIFIAGTSCVDFSSLNSKKTKEFADLRGANNKWEDLRKKKTDRNVQERLARDDLDDDDWRRCIDAMMAKTGQSRTSTTTFASAMNYLKEREPKIVIFENVHGAPWETALKCVFPIIGYAAVVAGLDTKDFYLPQTRLRKYVVGFNVAFFGERAATALCAAVKAVIASLGRKYSSGITNFLLPSNSHELHRARNEMELASQNTQERDTDWAFSRSRHTQFRRAEGIPDERSWIKWRENGSSLPPAKMWKAWESRQPNRVKDLLECFYSLAIAGKNKRHGFYDPAHKAQILDASQNVDRVNMAQPFGGTGCLTPNAIPFLSFEARPITGSEALKLQGMPIENFDMSFETQSQLQDLAGNAMSTTVVGAVILAALVCIANYDEENQVGWLEKVLFLKRDFEDVKKDLSSFRLANELVDFGNVRQLDELRLSACTPASVAEILKLGEKTRRRCVCQHILAYSSMDIYVCQVCSASLCKSCKGNPEHQLVRSEASFHELGSLTYARAEDQLRRFFPSVLPMLASAEDLADQIAQIFVSSSYKPKQNQALAEAVVVGLCNTVYELSFVEITDVTRIEYVSKDNYTVRAIVEEDAVTWYLHLDKWSDIARKMGVKHKTGQPLAKAVLRCDDHSQFPAADSWEVWVPHKGVFHLHFELRDESDEQVLLLRTEGLSAIPDEYTRRAIEDLESTRWFSHPECGMPERAFWVSTDPSKYHGKLFMYMDVNPIGQSQEDCFVISPICREMGRAPEPETRPVLLRIAAKYRLHMMLQQSKAFRVKASINGWWTSLKKHSIKIPPFHNDLALVTREHNFPVNPPASIRLPSNDLSLAVHGPDASCDRDQVLLSMSLPIFGQSQAAIQKLIQTMRDFDLSQQLDLAEFAYLISPCYTAVERAIIDYGQGSRSLQLWDIVLTEDCAKCAPQLPNVIFDKSPKRGTKSIAATYRDEDEVAYTQSLADQPTSFRVDHNVLLDVPDSKKMPNVHYVDVRFIGRAHTLMQQARSYLSQHPRYHGDDLKTRATCSIGLGVLEDPRLALAAIKIRPPPSAAGNLQPVGFRSEIQLLPEQLASLKWMLSRENDDAAIAFTEKEVSEVYIDHLRLRVSAQASRNIIRRGRVLADDVGFGKTAVCLGLIDRQRGNDMAVRTKRQQDPTLRGFVHLKATLVIVPNHLTQQWKSEADRFLEPSSYEIVVVETYQDLVKSGRMFKDADIIICSNKVFQDKTYRKELAKFHPHNGVNIDAYPKVYQHWYKKVVASLPPLGKQTAKSVIRILEYYTFARVIWDEFPYENTEVTEFVANCVTQSKWMLSGTPPLASLGKVCTIAHLFNVHLARPLSLVAGRQPNVCEHAAPEPLSELEQAQLYQSRPSPGFLQERHEQLLHFVHKFFSKNHRELTVKSSQLPVVLTLSSNSRSAYTDLQQDLSLRTYNANLVGSETRRRLMSRIDWGSKQLGMPRSVEALMLRASLSFADVKECMKFEAGDDQNSPVVIASAMYKNSAQTIEGLEERGRELFGKASYLAYRVAHLNVRNHVQKKDNGEDRQFSYYKTLENFKEGILAADFEDTYRGWDAFESAMRILIWDEQFEQELGTDRVPSWTEKNEWKTLLQSLWESMCFGVVAGNVPAPADSAARPEMLKRKMAALDTFSEFVTKTPLHSRRWFSVHEMSDDDFHRLPHLLQMEWDMKVPWEADYRSKNGGDDSTLVPLRALRRPNGGNLAPFSFDLLQKEGKKRLKDMKYIPPEEVKRVTQAMQARLGVGRILKLHWTEECSRQGLNSKSTEKVGELQNRVVLAAMGKASEEHWITPQGCALKFIPLAGEGKVRIRGGNMEALFDELMHTIDNLTIVISRLAPAHGKKNCLNVIAQVLAGKWGCDAHPDHDAIATHYVSLICGHVHCAAPSYTDICGVRGCTAPLADVCIPLQKFVEKPRVVRGNDFAEGALIRDPAPYLTSGDEGKGPKLNAIIGLIHSMAQEDQVVIFAQNSELLKDTYAALQAADITHVTAKELTDNESRAVESFKNSSWQADASQKKKVLVQQINSEQAAGSNLHNANHVIFVSPLITRNQTEWDAQMKQALGRCIRFRQTKLVHVYHMAMADTIEVDTLEWRYKKEVLVRPGHSVGRFSDCDIPEFLERFDAPETYTGKEPGWERAISMLPRSEIQMLMGDDYVSVTMARSKDTVESANAAVLEAQEAAMDCDAASEEDDIYSAS